MGNKGVIMGPAGRLPDKKQNVVAEGVAKVVSLTPKNFRRETDTGQPEAMLNVS